MGKLIWQNFIRSGTFWYIHDDDLTDEEIIPSTNKANTEKGHRRSKRHKEGNKSTKRNLGTSKKTTALAGGRM
jgi:hypothetical protein